MLVLPLISSGLNPQYLKTASLSQEYFPGILWVFLSWLFNSRAGLQIERKLTKKVCRANMFNISALFNNISLVLYYFNILLVYASGSNPCSTPVCHRMVQKVLPFPVCSLHRLLYAFLLDRLA